MLLQLHVLRKVHGTRKRKCFEAVPPVLQRSAKVGASGLVNFTAADAYHLCPSLPAAFTQRGASTLADLCRHTSFINYNVHMSYDNSFEMLDICCQSNISPPRSSTSGSSWIPLNGCPCKTSRTDRTSSCSWIEILHICHLGRPISTLGNNLFPCYVCLCTWILQCFPLNCPSSPCCSSSPICTGRRSSYSWI